jgi:hypothetical protein
MNRGSPVRTLKVPGCLQVVIISLHGPFGTKSMKVNVQMARRNASQKG